MDWVDVDATHQAIVCTVPRGNERPYVYDGRPYKRVQSSTTVMKRDEYNRMLKERRRFESPWEAMPNPALMIDDIDLEEVRRTARKAMQMGRLDASVNTEDALGLLDHFKLRENGVLLNGAAVLFGNDKSVRYSHLEVKMGWFRGTTDREFLDNRHVSGNIFKLMDEAMAFCFKHLNLSAKIGGKLERDEALEVPAAALREALVNAFAHREYGDTRTVYLAVYADRVEIKSPGGFPTSFDMERLYDPPVCDSNPRNPRIAHVLYLCKMIETWGRGLGVIARECARAGLPLPVTTMRWGSAVTTFKRPNIDASGSDLDQYLDRDDPDPIQIDSYPGGDLARRLLSTIRRNPLISRKLLSVELNVSERKIRDSLKILKDSGVIARQGPDHGGIWRISRRVAPNGDVNHGASKVAGKQGKYTENPSEYTEKYTEKQTENSGEYTENTTERADKLTETEERIVAILRQNKFATQGGISVQLGVTRTYITKIMGRLQTRKIIRRVGPDKGGYWEV